MLKKQVKDIYDSLIAQDKVLQDLLRVVPKIPRDIKYSLKGKDPIGKHFRKLRKKGKL